MTVPENTSTESSGKLSSVTCLIRNVVPTWKRMLRQAQQQVLVFCPYINTITGLREAHNDIPLFVYTEFSLELFASGASSLRALKEIRSWENTEVLWQPGLHAKIIVVDGQVMTLGSQNMTVRGEKNLEATSLITAQELVAASLPALNAWMEQAIPITDAMIVEIERLLPPVQKVYRAYARLCNAGQELIRQLAEEEMEAQAQALAEQAARERQRQKEEQRLLWKRKRRIKDLKGKEISLLQQIRDAVGHVQKRVNIFFPEDHITEEIARDFVSESAWWLTHKSGPKRARRAQWHVYRSPCLGYCWSYSRNSNKFMVERAVIRCKEWLLYFLEEERWNNQNNTHEALFNHMKSSVINCVANCDDEPYQGRYRTRNNDILFGSNSIDAKDFVECFLFRYADARDLIDALKELEKAREEINNDSCIAPDKESE